MGKEENKVNKMSRKKATNTVFLVVFVGIILSFSIAFAMTAIFAPEKTISNTYFDGSKGEKNIFSWFDDACLKNKDLYDLIRECEYRLFNNIPHNDVIGGKEGFLFNCDTNEFGYNYIDDYTGKIVLSEEQLDRFHRYLQMRSQAYENFGSDYVLAIIPNTQTVYGEHMPLFLGDISKNTMLSQIIDYLRENDFDKVVDLRDLMLEKKQFDQLYNNTENTVNSAGAYVVYSGIVDHFNEKLGIGVNKLEYGYLDLRTRITDGKYLAKKAGLESLIKNRTVYVSDSNEHIYTLVELFGDFETTYVKYEHKKSASDVTVMVECAHEWDKVQLMPYFSSTFYRTSYRVSHMYNRNSVTSSIPDVVVQVIREDELWSIIDRDIVSSYNDGLEHGQHPYQTMAATDVRCTRINELSYCVTGMVESGAEITLFGDGIRTISAQELDGRFFAVVTVENPDVATQISISVKTGDKAISDISYTLISADDRITNASGVFIGENSMLYKSFYRVPSVPADAVINSFNKKINAYFEAIETLNAAEDTKIIFTVIPEKISVYKNGLNRFLSDSSTELKGRRMIVERALSSSKVTFLDGTNSLLKHVGDSKLFYQTYDGLTDFGSYFIYSDIMKNVSTDFPHAKPYELDGGHYTLLRKKVSSGDLSSLLGFISPAVNETADGIITEGNYNTIFSDEKKDYSGGFVTVKNNASLPTAVVVRSGDSDKIVELMAEHFSIMHVLPKGVTEIPENILENGIDYVIVLASEMDLKIG